MAAGRFPSPSLSHIAFLEKDVRSLVRSSVRAFRSLSLFPPVILCVPRGSTMLGTERERGTEKEREREERAQETLAMVGEKEALAPASTAKLWRKRNSSRENSRK